MNERIKELWQLAADASAAYPSGQNNSWETQVNFLDKFAELIVRECAKVCDELQKWPSTEPRHCASDIRIHFGVEE